MCLDVCARNISKSRLIQCIAQNMTKSRRIYALFPGVLDVIHDPHESWKTEMDDLGHTHKSATSNQDNKAWPSSPQLLTGLPHPIESTWPPLTPISVACRFAVKPGVASPRATEMHGGCTVSGSVYRGISTGSPVRGCGPGWPFHLELSLVHRRSVWDASRGTPEIRGLRDPNGIGTMMGTLSYVQLLTYAIQLAAVATILTNFISFAITSYSG